MLLEALQGLKILTRADNEREVADCAGGGSQVTNGLEIDGKVINNGEI